MYRSITNSLSQVPNIRIIRRGLKLPLFIVQPGELDLIPHSLLKYLALFIDRDGNLHYELNHFGYNPMPWSFRFWEPLWNRSDYFDSLPQRLIETSPLRKERELIGGVHFVFDRKKEEIEVRNIGLLKGIPSSEARKKAFAKLHAELDRYARLIGAKSLFCSTQTIAGEKLAQYGWRPVQPTGLRERIRLWYSSFPIKGHNHYRKSYSQNRP